MENNPSVKMMERINNSVAWENIESLFRKDYPVDQSHEKAAAYPPMMLSKGMLLQKWFRIPSGLDLENQINDRISFKKFLGLPFGKLSLDQFTFSRFRSRLSREAIIEINHEFLLQFARMGFSINERIAVDARLVKSASRAVSNDKLAKRTGKSDTPDGRRDGNGRPLTFSRDLESDWTLTKDRRVYGLKWHGSVDVTNGFILAPSMTPASFHKSTSLPYCMVASSHTHDTIKKVYPDKGFIETQTVAFIAQRDQ